MLLKAITDYKRFSDAKLIEFITFVLSCMVGNLNFASPDPTLATITTALNDFSSAASAAGNGDSQKIRERDDKREALLNLMFLLQAYVIFESKNVRTVAESSGFKFSSSNVLPAPGILAPQNLVVMNTNQSGVVKVSVNAVKGAKAYMHQYTTDPTKEDSWVSMTCTQSKCTISGLTPGVVYYWRVAAIGSKDQIMYSDVISRMAV